MHGDFSRLTFDARKHYRSVYMQQGRVQLDADWNEQIDILYHYFQTQFSDLLGTSGAMAATAGFQIAAIDDSQESSSPSAQAGEQQPHEEHKKQLKDLLIQRGNYYVDGILCENEQDVLFSQQPYYPVGGIPANLAERSIVYLDVWQRDITALEDTSLREIALGGPDTTTRTQLVWQVKLLPLPHRQGHELFARGRQVSYAEVIALPAWRELHHRQTRKSRLAARRVPHSSTLDNQLYRVEIHHIHHHKATFKWSRENGSLLFGVEKILSYQRQGNSAVQCVLSLSDASQDAAQLQVGDWVELIDDEVALRGHTLPLYRVTHISETSQRQITLTGTFTQMAERLTRPDASPLLLRRWDHGPVSSTAQESGTYPVLEDTWLDLERGIQIAFSAGDIHNVGDYWLIPSRTLSNDIEWPQGASGPLALPPHGVEHHYCPLALLHLDHHGSVLKDLRQLFAPLPVLTEQIASGSKLEEIKTTIIEQVVERNMLYEECHAQGDLEPGDLVSLLPGTDLEVTKASKENAKLLFGVVSRVIEDAGQRRVRVTTYGRVRCKVSGSIEAGDLLTVAEEHGHAAKTGPVHEFLHAGSLLGKALEASPSPEASPSADASNVGAATIEILVSLQ